MAQDGIITHPQEHRRLEALHELQILDTPIETRFEQITDLVRTIFDVPIAALSCIDLRRQWFKSIQGLEVEQTQRCVAFCQHTIVREDVMVIEDARLDDRFSANPLVTGDPGIVFYAGAPIYSPGGLPVASLCIIGHEPRSLDEREIAILHRFARLAETMLQSPRASVVEESLVRNVGESWRAAMIDPVTRVWNAEGMHTMISESARHASASGDQIGVGLLEIVGLYDPDTQLSNTDRDTLIRGFARRAIGMTPAHDSIGRMRRGEFGMVFTRVFDAQDLRQRLSALHAIIDELCDDLGMPAVSLRPASACYLLEPEDPIGVAELTERIEDGVLCAARAGQTTPQIIPEGCEESQPKAA